MVVITPNLFIRNGHQIGLNSGSFNGSIPLRMRFAASAISNTPTSLPDNSQDDNLMWSSIGLGRSCEGDGKRLRPLVAKMIPDPKQYKLGDIIVIANSSFTPDSTPEEEVILVRGEVGHRHHPTWIAVKRYGAQFRDCERSAVKNVLGLKLKIPQKEFYGVSIIDDNFKGNFSENSLIKSKLPNPRTSDNMEYTIPNTNITLHLRMSKAKRVWVYLPTDKKTMTEKEQKAIESFLAAEFKYDVVSNLQPVDLTKDIICYNELAKNYFCGAANTLKHKLADKLPNPNKYTGSKYFSPPESPYNKLSFELKLNERGFKTWTIKKEQHKLAAKYFELKRKINYPRVPENAIICWGKKVQDFWEDAKGSDYKWRQFQAKIKDRLGDPNEFDESSLTIKKGKLECKVYIGERITGKPGEEKRTGYKFWYVKKETDRKILAQIIGLDNELPEDTREFIAMVRNQAVPKPCGRDKDDGTDDPRVQHCKRSTKVY